MDVVCACDVFLDPYPFGGGVTALEALHCGLPIVTLPTRQSVHQLAAGFTQASGHINIAITCVPSPLCRANRWDRSERGGVCGEGSTGRTKERRLTDEHPRRL